MSVIEGLCKGHGCLERNEVAMFLDGIKQAKYPKYEETKSSVETTKTQFYGKLTKQGLLNTNRTFARYVQSTILYIIKFYITIVDLNM